MPMYREVVAAAGDTATAIIKHRMGAHRPIVITTAGGSTASVVWADNKPEITLNLPTLPPDAWMTRSEADRVVGYIAHECCHVMHTQWAAWQRAVRDGPDISGLVNCLEDVRIEKTEIDAGHYPALRGLLGSLMTQKHAEGLAKAKAKGITIGACREHMPYAIAVLGRLANGYTIPTAHALARDLSPGVRKLVAHALRHLPKCQNTEDVRRLAHALRRMEREAQAKAEAEAQAKAEAQKPQDAPESENASQGQGAPQDAPEGQGEPTGGEDASQGQGEPQDAPEGQDRQPGASSDQSTGGTTEPEPQGEAIDPDDMTTLIEAIAEQLAKDPTYAGDQYSHLLPLVRVTMKDVNAGDARDNLWMAKELTRRLPHCGVLHGQIARMLMSEEKGRRTHHETSGRLDRRALVRMRTGAPDVYSQRENTPAVQTALVILVDQSSSMKNCGRMPMTKVATWALARATEDAGAKVRIVGFTSPSGMNHNVAALRLIKDWDTHTAAAAYAIATMDTFMGTPLSPSIITAAEMLQDVNATRRIVMVLTDGQCNFEAPAVTIACRIAAGMGVEAVGIGMNCERVIAAFPDGYSVNIEDLDQLATTGLGTLVRMLEDADRGR